MIYRFLELTLAPALRIGYHPAATGVENVPVEGPAILASNHVSFSDEFFTPLMSRRRVAYFAKAEYFNSPGLRGRAMAAFFEGCGHVPVERSDPRSAASVIDIGVEVLGEGRVLGIFPEGTRSPDGRLHKFRTGIARVALRSGAPVIPVGIVGTRDVQPPGSTLWRRAPVTVNFGAPLDFREFAGRERSARVLREVTETVRGRVQALSGQEYVDTFASSAKDAG